MAKETKISWADGTMNPWIGCTEVSEGCDNCYARTLNHRWGKDNWGKGKPRVMTSDSYWKQPLKWNRDALQQYGRRMRVFCGSLCDIMDDEAPAGVRERLWHLIDQTPNIHWLLLTKRPHRYARYLPEGFLHNNVAYGTTAENQKHFDIRFPIIQEIAIQRGGISWISYEPALGPISIVRSPLSGFYYNLQPDWVIFGGETGHKHRPALVQWARALRNQCHEFGVSFFMKQMSGTTPDQAAAAIPTDLLIQQFPTTDIF